MTGDVSTVDPSRRSRPVRPDCKHVDRHTLGPDRYVEWHVWAEEMVGRGFRQKQCPGCHLYVIWYRPEVTG